MSAYDDNITGNANCVAYWTLDGTVNDSEGTNHLSGGTAGTYVEGPFGYDHAMSFNGTNQSISSASAIDLTGTNKVTVMFYIYESSYDTENARSHIEFTTNYLAQVTGFSIVSDGTSAGDPVTLAVRGDALLNYATYYNTTFNWGNSKWRHLTAILDKSQTTNEVDLYINGILATPSARPQTNNNTNNFGNATLFVGSRNNASLFCQAKLAKIALFNTALTAQQIATIYSLGVNARKSYMKLDSSLKLRD